MSLPEQLNHYRILEPLGKGGMGEVFVAEDTRLQRRVALKVLSSLMASDPERRQRFEREAQAVAALNHPNIVTIHSVEEDHGIPFLTMELVEGRTLADVIAEGPMPVDRLLRIGMAISDAIAAAHQRGITHRDLKPANVVVGTDGRVKVLDFGLAKLRESQLAGDSDVTRMPTTDLTGDGRIMGTVAYMSPEQAEGKPVDHRTDIFSLGVLLHEMATGEKPFKGDTNVAVLSSVLKDTPSPITEIRPELPPELDRVVRRALAKDPSRRYQTATDVRNDLEELKLESDSGITRTAVAARVRHDRPSPRKRLVIAGLAIFAVAGIAVALATFLQRGGSRGEPLKFEADRFSRLTVSGDAFLAALSPDGRYVAHVKASGGQPSLWMRQTATTSDVQIVPPAAVRYDGITFSPEGDHVYYNTYEQTGGVAVLYRVPLLGGTPQRVLEDVDSRISFAPDRSRFTFTRGAPSKGTGFVMVANVDGTGVRELASLPAPQLFANTGPAWSPDGRTILAVAQSFEGGPHTLVYGVNADMGAVTPIPGRWAFANDIEWLPDGRSFAMAARDFSSGGSPQIWQVTYPSGETRRITNDLNAYTNATFSADGKSLVTVQVENSPNLWVAPASDLGGGLQITRGGARGDGLTGLTWTPDGRIVFGSNVSSRPQIWIADADGANERQLTSDAANIQPDVTPDGQYIAFQRVTEKGSTVWRMRLDGSDQRQLTQSGADLQPRAGIGFVFFNNTSSGQPRGAKVPVDGGQPVSLGDYYFRPLQVSPDGTRLLGVTWDTAARRPALAIVPVDGGAPQVVPDLPSFSVAWHPDGKGVTYGVPKLGLQFTRYDLASRKSEPVGLVRDNVFNFAWSRDGKRMLLARGPNAADVIVITAKSPTRERQ